MGIRKLLAVVLCGLAGQVMAQPAQGPLVSRAMSVTPYIGQTVRVVIEARSCSGSPVGFIADNFAISGGNNLLNGSFESGLADWVGEANDCSIDTAGDGDPIGYAGGNAAPTPTQGVALAASSAFAPGACRLSQDVAITGAGTLTADVGWTFTRFAAENPNCEVSLRLEEPQGGAILDQVIVFTPAALSTAIPATPLWALGLLSGLLAVFGWRRLATA
jgi:hypothetical protein